MVKKEIPFKTIADNIIQYIEGGYFHPDMAADGRMKFRTEEIRKTYLKSGETLYGIDRKTFNPNEAYKVSKQAEDLDFIKFWELVDQYKLRQIIRRWNSFPDLDKDKILRGLLYKFQNRWYTFLLNRYLTNEAKQLVKDYPGLKLQMIYSSWNGSGFFQKFGRIINQNTTADPDIIYDKIQQARMLEAEVIRNGVPKLDRVANFFTYAS